MSGKFQTLICLPCVAGLFFLILDPPKTNNRQVNETTLEIQSPKNPKQGSKLRRESKPQRGVKISYYSLIRNNQSMFFLGHFQESWSLKKFEEDQASTPLLLCLRNRQRPPLTHDMMYILSCKRCYYAVISII